MVPFTISLALYIAIQVFGPLMFTESFHYTPGEAAAMNSWFWGGNVVALIFVGMISDGLQMRKPISILGAILTCILLAWWIPTFGEALPRGLMQDRRDDARICLAILSVPWAAQYSEALEEISPAIQATGWAFYGLATRAWLAISVPVMIIIAGEIWMGSVDQIFASPDSCCTASRCCSRIRPPFQLAPRGQRPRPNPNPPPPEAMGASCGCEGRAASG